MLRYLDQDTQQTLKEGLTEYFASIPGLLTEANASKEVAALMLKHDVGHVVFGCDTTLNGEPLADTWQMFGTDVPFREYLRYTQLPETRAVFLEVGFGSVIAATVRAVPRLITVLWRVFRMSKKWPFHEHDQYMNIPLAQIRAEFGIRLVRH